MALTFPGLLILLPDGMRTVLAPHRDRGHVRARLFLGGFASVRRCVLTALHHHHPHPGPVRPESPVPAWRWFAHQLAGITQLDCPSERLPVWTVLPSDRKDGSDWQAGAN